MRSRRLPLLIATFLVALGVASPAPTPANWPGAHRTAPSTSSIARTAGPDHASDVVVERGGVERTASRPAERSAPGVPATALVAAALLCIGALAPDARITRSRTGRGRRHTRGPPARRGPVLAGAR